MSGRWMSQHLALACASLLFAGCSEAGEMPLQPEAVPTAAKLKAKNKPAATTAQLLVSGLQGAVGSTVGPGGALYVTEPATGSILRVDPRTGAVTPFASGLPTATIAGGVLDVAFIGGTAYALVTLILSDVGTRGVVGIYRVDGPNHFTIIADIGAFNLANPPTGFDFFALAGAPFALETYRGGFLVTDGHLNRVLYVTLEGEISVFRQFGNIVPTGLDTRGNRVYMAEAGPIPHLPEDGKVVVFQPLSATATEIASGARLLVDVEFGRGNTLFALSQGIWDGAFEGSPALPNTGALVQVNGLDGFTVVAEGLDRPTSLEIIGNTAYVVTLPGEIWKIDNVSGPPFGASH